VTAHQDDEQSLGESASVTVPESGAPDAKGRTVAELQRLCEAMALRARAERQERNRQALVEMRNRPETVRPDPAHVDEVERDEARAQIIALDRWTARGAR